VFPNGTTNVPFQENGNHETLTDPFTQSINVDELLADSSVMFPRLDSNAGDVNDLFGELELLLSVSSPLFNLLARTVQSAFKLA